MSNAFSLPDGGSAIIRDPKLVTERHRRPVTRLNSRIAGSAVGQLLASKDSMDDKEFEEEARKLLATDEWELLDELNDALIVALVESWPYPAPITVDGLLDIPGEAYDALKAETAKHVTALMPSFSVSPVEESPTPPLVD